MADSSTEIADLLEELSRLLRTASTLLDKRIGVDLGDVTVPQWHVLAALSAGSALPMTALQGATQLTGPSLTRLIDGMIDANLVFRKVGDVDRRHVLVALTRRGTQVHQACRTAMGTAGPGLLAEADEDLTARLSILVESLRRGGR